MHAERDSAPSRHGRILMAGAAAVVTLAGSAQAGPIFAPNTKPEYVKRFYENLQAAAETRALQAGPDRFTPPDTSFGNLLDDFVFVDEREGDPRDRDIEIFWSYAEEGLAMESTDASLDYLGIGQSQSPDELTDDNPGGIPAGLLDNFRNVLFSRLNDFEPPFGFAGIGGQRAWQQIIFDSIQRWDELTGIEFIFIGGEPVPPAGTEPSENGDTGAWDTEASGFEPAAGTAGDLRFAMADLDGPTQPDGSAGGILAWVYQPRSVPPAGDPVIDPDCFMNMPPDCDPTFGYAGNIILDKQERWTDPGTPDIFAVVVARAIGVALGLNYSCPSNPEEPFALMQLQDLGEAFPPLFFTTPQEDDIRAAQLVFGDTLETNDIFTDAFDIIFQPTPGSNTFLFAPHLSAPPSLFPRSTQLSLGLEIETRTDPDADMFRLVLPDNISVADLTVTIEPVGTPFVDQLIDPGSPNGFPLPPTCFGPQFVVDPRSAQDLRFTVQTFDPFVNSLTTILEENRTGIGEAESVTLPVSGGIYYIRIEGDGSLTDTQLYNLTLQVVTEPLEAGEDVEPVASDIGADAFYDIGVFGLAARIATIDGAHVADAHDTFGGRDIPRISWPGVNPAVTSASSHATSVAAVAAGDAVGGFAGLAPDAEIASASVATQVFEDGTFSIGKTALYYGLFALADPALSSRVGLDGPASVIVSTWSGGGLSRNGDDAVSQAYDAVVSMHNVNVVVAAGNSGRTEGQGFGNCPINPAPAQGAPGVNFLGERTVVPPATAYNVLTVGALARSESGVYDLVAGFSSRGPIDANDQAGAGTDQANVRPGVHLVAPGSGFAPTPPDFDDQGELDPCDYEGPTPTLFLNVPAIAPGDDPDSPSDPSFLEPNQGTSIAAGFVAGGIALLQDAASLESPALSTWPGVVKAVLLTGAVKLTGWNNIAGEGPGRPQDQRDGLLPDDIVIANPAVQPLDVAQGAGRVDLERSLEIYLTGYAPAFPPQANFDGPTIDPPQTDPSRPTMRRPRESNQDPLRGVAGAGSVVAPTEPKSITADQERLLLERSVSDPRLFVGRPLQVRQDPDLKDPRPPLGPGVETGPQSPLIPPKLPGGGTTPPGVPGPGQPPPGTPEGDGGSRPVEIDPIFVDPLGWDDATIDQRNVNLPNGGGLVQTGFIDYVINVPLLATRPDPRDPTQELPADQITVSLAWLRTFILSEVNFASTSDPRIGSIESLELENLDLELYLSDPVGNVVGDLYDGVLAVAASRSVWGNTEHITFTIPQDGIYLIRVRWVATQYDIFNTEPTAETRYGVAWRVDFSPRPAVGRPTGVNDLVSAVKSYGTRIGVEGYSLEGDANKDGRVDFTDITSVLSRWRQD